MTLPDIAKAVAPDANQEIIGIRPGEKLHEQMIGIEDAPQTYSYDDYFKILPMIHKWNNDPKRIKDGVLVAEDFVYSSDNNNEWLSVEELESWVKENSHKIGVI